MGNTIHRNTFFIECMSKVNSSAYTIGECYGVYRDEDNSHWISKTEKHLWNNPGGLLRNEDYVEILNQYSLSDIVYELQKRNADYYTVMWEMLVDAIKTTFEETRVDNIEDIYNYVVENLI